MKTYKAKQYVLNGRYYDEKPNNTIVYKVYNDREEKLSTIYTFKNTYFIELICIGFILISILTYLTGIRVNSNFKYNSLCFHHNSVLYTNISYDADIDGRIYIYGDNNLVYESALTDGYKLPSVQCDYYPDYKVCVMYNVSDKSIKKEYNIKALEI